MSHVPRVLVRPDPQLPSQLLGGYALEVGRVEIDGDAPLPHRKFGVVHDGVGLDREVLAAVFPRFAPPSAERTPAFEFGHFGTARRAFHAVRPPLRDDPFLGGFVVSEPLCRLNESDALPLDLRGCRIAWNRCTCHTFMLSGYDSICKRINGVLEYQPCSYRSSSSR